MASKKKNQARLRLVIDRGSLGRSSSSLLTAAEFLEIRGELFDMTDSGIFDFSSRDLLDRSLRDTATIGDSAPVTLGRLQVGQDKFVHAHRVNNKPDFGVMQPSNGRALPIRFLGMSRPSIPAARTSAIGSVLTENAEALLPVAYPMEPNDTKRIAALAKRIGVGKETIRRAIKGGASSRLNVIDKIAVGLGVTTPELLTPGYGPMRAAEVQAQAARPQPLQRYRALLQR